MASLGGTTSARTRPPAGVWGGDDGSAVRDGGEVQGQGEVNASEEEAGAGGGEGEDTEPPDPVEGNRQSDQGVLRGSAGDENQQNNGREGTEGGEEGRWRG